MFKKIISGIGIVNLLIFFSIFKRPNKKWRYRCYDCGIICGFPALNNGKPSKIMQSRVEKGVELYKAGKIKFLIMSGGAVKNEYEEAKVMRDYAISLGVLKKHIIIENQALSTYHNLMYCHDLMKLYNLNNAIVVTNSWHLRKANYYARKFKLDYVMVSANPPKSYNCLKIIFLHLQTNLLMYYNLFKGYY